MAAKKKLKTSNPPATKVKSKGKYWGLIEMFVSPSARTGSNLMVSNMLLHYATFSNADKIEMYSLAAEYTFKEKKKAESKAKNSEALEYPRFAPVIIPQRTYEAFWEDLKESEKNLKKVDPLLIIPDSSVSDEYRQILKLNKNVFHKIDMIKYDPLDITAGDLD